MVQFSSVQSLSRVWLFVTAHQASLSITNSQSSLKPRPSSRWYHPNISSSVVPFSSCPQSLPASESFPMSQLFTWGGQNTGISALASFLPKKTQDWSPSEWTSIFPRFRVFSNESVLRIRWPKDWSFSFSISPPNEYSGLISFRIDWLDLFAVQGTLKSLLQHHSSKASIFQRSAFFIVQLSYPYMTTGKSKALTRWTFVGKAMSLLFNMLLGFIITFLPRSKCLFISWLQSPSAVILEPPK